MSQSFASIRKRLTDGTNNLPNVVDRYLKNIEVKRDLNAFISVRGRDVLMKKAAAIQKRIKTGDAGRLAGMVVGVKDVIATRLEPTTCASRSLRDYVSPYDATVVTRLEEADALVIGKTNCDEFAMGSSNENSFFGPVRHPIDSAYVPGGSSGGSAVAVAADLCTTALGTDTGGSVRQPAGFCGVIGLKPTYGRISRYGLVAYGSSLDQVGIFSNNVDDCATVLEVLAGHDPRDATSAQFEVSRYTDLADRHLDNLRIGIPAEFFQDGIDPEVDAAVISAIAHLRNAGAEVLEVSLPHTEYAVAAYYLLATAEASSNLSRYDGVRFSHRTADPQSIHELYAKSRSEAFGPEVKLRIMLGTFALSAGYYDAYYGKAQKIRALIRKDFVNAFKSCDCLITPTSPTTAFRIGEKVNDPLKMYLADIFTISANLAGIPAISVPCGKNARGLPIGVQAMCRPFGESVCFQVGRALETMEHPE